MKATLDFLKKLKRNNKKEWFQENRALFDAANAEFLEFVTGLIAGIAKFDRSVSGVRAKDCTFRIYRDVRFARDKSPYKTNFGANIVGGGKKSGRAGYYLHVEPGECMLGGGIWMPEAPVLMRLRRTIAEAPRPFEKILSAAPFRKTFGGLWEHEKLKTVPRGFEKDHPAAELLKHKSYVVVHGISDAAVQQKDFSKKAAGVFGTMKPFIEYLNRAAFG